METALVAYLLSRSPVTALTGQRITWGRREQGAPLPAIVLHRIDGAPDYHLEGPSGLVVSRVQVDCWGDTYADAKRAAEAVAAPVNGIRFTQGATRFAAVLIVDQRDSNFDESGEAIFRTSLDLSITHAPA